MINVDSDAALFDLTVDHRTLRSCFTQQYITSVIGSKEKVAGFLAPATYTGDAGIREPGPRMF